MANINFPSTINQPTDGSFSHTASGVTWSWDGTTWKAQGINLAYTLPTASATVKGGIKVGNNLSIDNVTGVLSASSSVSNLNDLGDVSTSGASSGEVLKYNGSSWAPAADDAGTTINTVNDIGNVTVTNAQNNDYLSWNGSAWVNGQISSASGLEARTTGQATASGLANGGNADLTITAAKTYALHAIQTSHAAWVTLYTDTTSRTNDAARNETTDPLPGAGVIAEVITSDGSKQRITPGTIGYNDDGTPSTSAYIKVVNKSGGTQDITVTLHFVKLEV
tara:strand:+ start:163 stop:999 length:837 start_codon:yes stop_codon:yes gene_type:complete